MSDNPNAGRVKVLHRPRHERHARVLGQIANRLEGPVVLLVPEQYFDCAVNTRRDRALGEERHRDVDGPSSRMKQVERPEVERASGEIDPHGHAYRDVLHSGLAYIEAGAWAGAASADAVRGCVDGS